MNFPNAKLAAKKISFLKGSVNRVVLVRYGVPEDEATAYLKWLGSKAGQFERALLRGCRRKGKARIFTGYNSAKG